MPELLFETLERVRTYKIQKWNYRCPQLFHPYILALQGYECIDFDIIQCSICKNTVQFSSQQANLQVDIDYGKIQKQIKDHHKDCLYANIQPEQYNYKKAFSQGKIYLNIDLINERCLKAKKEQYWPIINNQIFWKMITDSEKAQMVKMVMKKCQMPYPKYHISFVLKIFGWFLNSQSGQVTQQLECFFCGATAKINDYLTVNIDKQPQEIENPEDKQLFDPAQEHRYFCIWNYEFSGWQLWIQHLWDKLAEVKELFRKQNPEAMKKIRLNLDKYLESFSAARKEQFEKINKIYEECKKLVEGFDQKNVQEINQGFQKSSKKMESFLEMIDEGLRSPLKKLKID